MRALEGANPTGGGPERRALRERLLAVIRHGASSPITDSEFDRLAADLFHYQFTHNAPYGAYCRARGVGPDDVRGWREIPAVPTDAFKAVPLICGDSAEAAVTFRTSGTTVGAGHRGLHYLLETDLYRAALRAGFHAHLLPDRDRMPIVSLIPAARDHPDSSLSFMVTDVMEAFGTADSATFVSAAGLEVGPLIERLERVVATSEPVLVVGTSIAILFLIEELNRMGTSFRLPPGSRAMDTGGFKRGEGTVRRQDLYTSIESVLGIPVRSIVNEYGMTEMSSQFYDAVAGAGPRRVEDRCYHAPAWVRTLAVDPETLEPLPEGEPGALRHIDLANLDSVVALQTADIGAVTAAGIQLRGRAAGAEVRGCSVAMAELLEALGQG